MNTPKLDVDSLIEALRDDLPNEREEARVRARLVATGVLAATALTSAEVAAGTVTAAGALGKSVTGAAGTAAGAAAVGGAGTSIAPLGALQAGVAQVGLWSKVIALPLATKIGIAGTVAVGVAAGSVPMLRDGGSPNGDRAVAAVVERAPERASSARPSGGDRQTLPLGAAAPNGAEPNAEATLEPAGSVPAFQATSSDVAQARAVQPVPPPAPVGARTTSKAADVRAGTAPAERATAPAASSIGAPARAAGKTSAAAPSEAVTAAPPRAEGGREPAASVGAPVATRDAVARADSSAARGGSAPPQGAGAPAPNAYASASTLAEETGLMERAIAALHDGDLERARHWLGEHERRFPNGLLARERHRALARVESQAR